MASREHDDETKATIKEFKDAVNMTASELEKWLKTVESNDVGYKVDGTGESVGHVSGRTIVKILGTKQADYTDADMEQMRRTVSYVHRHLAQRPDGDVSETRWRYSLMNWGHDPLKK